METNKPGILTKPGNNGAVVPALLLHSFQQLLAGVLGRKGASISLNVGLQHLLCSSILELCLNLGKGLWASSATPF